MFFDKDQCLYPSQDQDAKPQSGTSSILQSPKSGLKGHGCSLHLQIQDREPKFGSWVYQRQVTISKSRSRCQTQSGTSSILQSPKAGLKGHRCSLHLQNKDRAKIWIIGVQKTSDHIQIKIKMPNPSQEPPASSKVSNKDLKDMGLLFTFKIKIESRNLEQECTK